MSKFLTPMIQNIVNFQKRPEVLVFILFRHGWMMNICVFFSRVLTHRPGFPRTSSSVQANPTNRQGLHNILNIELLIPSPPFHILFISLIVVQRGKPIWKKVATPLQAFFVYTRWSRCPSISFYFRRTYCQTK